MKFLGLFSLYWLQSIWISQLNPVNYIPVAFLPATDQQLGDGVRQNQVLNDTTKVKFLFLMIGNFF